MCVINSKLIILHHNYASFYLLLILTLVLPSCFLAYRDLMPHCLSTSIVTVPTCFTQVMLSILLMDQSFSVILFLDLIQKVWLNRLTIK